VAKQVVPKVMNGVEIMSENNIKLAQNTLRLDSLQQEVNRLDSILHMPYNKRFPNETFKTQTDRLLIDSLERQVDYLNALLNLPYEVRFPEVKEKIDSLYREINYLDSMIKIPFDQRNFNELKK
jgi:hypothetical protein